MKTIPAHTRLPQPTVAAVDVLANEEGRTRSQMLLRLVEQALRARRAQPSAAQSEAASA